MDECTEHKELQLPGSKGLKEKKVVFYLQGELKLFFIVLLEATSVSEVLLLKHYTLYAGGYVLLRYVTQ